VSADFPSAARTALRDTQLRRNLAVATQTIREKRGRVVEERPDWQALRDAGEALKQRVLRHLDSYLVQFESAVRNAGGHVHWARDAAEANALVVDIARAHGAGEVVKVKSLTTDEIELNEALAAAGVPDSFAGAKTYAENPSLISRSHFARHLVKTGLAPDVKSVFQRYLVKGKPGFVPHQWASLGDAVSWIRASGGIAVVAHPGRYNFSKPELHAFLAEFRDCGGAGIEVVTGSHSPEQYFEFARIAREFGFTASRGSDYHGKGESRADLGTLPQLPYDLKPVWHDW